MTMVPIIALTLAVLIAAAAYLFFQWRSTSFPDALAPGTVLPDFSAQTEAGATVQSDELRGAPAVILFVRGNWCPFCSAQVKNLTDHYKAIGELGARLVLVTPKPLQTTRRVADFFDVDFEFWLDEDLAVAHQLGLVLKSSVPKGHREEYGENTMRPTAVIVDADGKIRFTKMSKFLADRPNPEELLEQLGKISSA